MKTVFYGRQEYVPMWQEMQEFTNTRDDKTPDEIWFVEHPPVFTMGLNASEEHLLEPGDIPVIKTDRGGQVTFHGPGQLMIYPLIDLRRSNMGVRALVTALEQSVVNLAADYDVEAVARPDAPGVYVNGEKLASLGLRIRRGSSFHGMALNIAIDLEPFTRINPCGYAELQMTDLHRLGINLSLEDAADEFLPYLLNHLSL
jgi:lipoyl(octanoyl) transferase|tara:strand:+ start:5980 stop:6582 length:603 start_codon:yes stop_codon:yes gene_type:complete